MGPFGPAGSSGYGAHRARARVVVVPVEAVKIAAVGLALGIDANDAAKSDKSAVVALDDGAGLD